MAYTPQTWTDGAAGGTPISAARLGHIETGLQNAAQIADQAETDAQNAITTANNALAVAQSGGSGGGTTITGSVNDIDFGGVTLDSFGSSGATDDARLTAALSALGADTYPRTLLLPPIRKYSFATANRQPFEGLRVSGAWGFSNPERNSGSKVATAVGLTMNGAWFAPTATTFGCSFRNLALEGSGTNATFLNGAWDCLLLRDIYSSALRSVLGTQASRMTITASTFDGAWEINNCYSGAFHLAGSDNTFTWAMLLDSGTAFASAGGSAGQAHWWADSLDKTYIGPIYFTAEGAWRGVRHDGSQLNAGSTNAGVCSYIGIRLEGRNPSQPCDGSLFTINGGAARVEGLWVAYGMNAPGAGENGVITHNGGQLHVVGVMYDATNATQVTSTPFVWTEGGTGQDVIVQGIMRGSRGSGSWGTNRPIVKRLTAGAENRICDATVTQTTG